MKIWPFVPIAQTNDVLVAQMRHAGLHRAGADREPKFASVGIKGRKRSRQQAARRAVSTVEFALIAPMLIALTFGTIGAGVLVWAMTEMRTVAAIAARCGAVGAIGCTTTALTQNYAVALASAQIQTGVIAVADVTATSGTGACNGFAGKFYTVSIVSSYFSHGALSLIGTPWNFSTISVTACSPMP